MIALLLWIKKYWRILLGALVGLLGFLFGVSVRKKPVLIQGEDPVKAETESQTAVKDKVLEEQRDEEVAQAQQEAAQSQASVVQQEELKTQQVQDDVDATNQYLQGVSKDIKGDS